MITLLEIAERLKSKKRIAIFTHVRPDGDTLSSAMALKLALLKCDIQADVFCSDAVPEKFIVMNDGYGVVKNSITEDYDCYIAVDVSDVLRIGSFSEKFQKQKDTLCIDHHISNNGVAKFTFVKENASNCENIYELIKILGVEIDSEIANFLLVGIVTDTGAFAHKNVTPYTLNTTAELVAKGGDLNKVIYHMFKLQTKERAKLFGMTMDKIRYDLDGKLGIIVISRENILKAGASADMTEGFIDFVMSIGCVEVGICLLETKERTYKVSFRSKGADVNAMAQVYGGGGHILASGCMINGYLEDVIDRLTYTVKQYT